MYAKPVSEMLAKTIRPNDLVATEITGREDHESPQIFQGSSPKRHRPLHRPLHNTEHWSFGEVTRAYLRVSITDSKPKAPHALTKSSRELLPWTSQTRSSEDTAKPFAHEHVMSIKYVTHVTQARDSACTEASVWVASLHLFISLWTKPSLGWLLLFLTMTKTTLRFQCDGSNFSSHSFTLILTSCDSKRPWTTRSSLNMLRAP